VEEIVPHKMKIALELFIIKIFLL